MSSQFNTGTGIAYACCIHTLGYGNYVAQRILLTQRTWKRCISKAYWLELNHTYIADTDLRDHEKYSFDG